MAHFAKIDSNNIVTEVIVSEKDFINSGKVGDEFLWIQTSYNGNFRKKFASVGDTYDKTKDKFISSKPFASWTLDSNDDWQPPVTRPTPSDGTYHDWNEAGQTWDLFSE
tara:strand:- start:1621 stop:1947 length:327 start_codon:yes stop_codon:yes gene_type:complete